MEGSNTGNLAPPNGKPGKTNLSAVWQQVVNNLLHLPASTRFPGVEGFAFPPVILDNFTCEETTVKHSGSSACHPASRLRYLCHGTDGGGTPGPLLPSNRNLATCQSLSLMGSGPNVGPGRLSAPSARAAPPTTSPKPDAAEWKESCKAHKGNCRCVLIAFTSCPTAFIPKAGASWEQPPLEFELGASGQDI